MLKYKQNNFTPNIFLKNSLISQKNLDLPDSFDYIATNPPWGAKYEKSIVNSIKENIVNIISKESFSFFIAKSFDLVKKGGILSFVLPESITNIKKHQDIRKLILENTSILEIEILGKKFKNVLSSVITLKLKKERRENNEILIKTMDKKYFIPQKRFLKNSDFIFMAITKIILF